MARGSRAPSHNAYRGSIGQTRKRVLHVTGPNGDLIATEVYTTIDAVTDPELVERLHGDVGVNVIRFESGETRAIATPVLYHDPAVEVMVLVLDEALRDRELDERIALLTAMRADPSPIPAYAKEFAVVFGGAGLRAYLEKRALSTLDQTRVAGREADLEKRTRELERTRHELELMKSELARGSAELAGRNAELARGLTELERARSEQRARVIAAVQTPPEPATTIAPRPTPLPQRDDLETKPIPFSDVILHDEPTTSSSVTALPPPPTAPTRPSSDVFEGLPTGVNNLAHLNGASAMGTMGNAGHAKIDQSEQFEGETPLPLPQVAFDDDGTTTGGSAIIPVGSDPLTSETRDLAVTEPDAWLADATDRIASSFLVQNGRVRLALVASPEIARGFGGAVDIRVLLYRTPDAPVVALVLGPPAALRVPSPRQIVALTLDIALEADRQVIATLAKKFVLDIEVVSNGRRMRHFELTAPLADNAGYILRAADDHLRGVAADGAPSFDRAVERVLTPGFDLLGTNHVDAGEFRDDKLAGLDTATKLRRAIAVARRFARPSREDYLVCTRGFPLPRWRELRRHVLDSAVTSGLWMGPELAQVAVSEGLARSRRDLVIKLDQGFAALRQHPTAFDLDDEAAADNTAAIAEEARALGVELGRPSQVAIKTPTTSEDAAAVSGSIAANSQPTMTPMQRARAESGPAISVLATPKAIRATDDLIAMLDSREHRLGAALELCDRGIQPAAAKVIASVNKMSRSDAVRVLGMSVKLGDAARQPLVEQLASSKAYLRQGAALALAMLRSEDGTQAVIDLLLTEPTEIWREIARAVGQVGPTALMPLASNFGRLGDRGTPALAERVAWAMAHVGVRGGKAALETMGGGQSVVAPVAKKALELIALAANDQVSVRPGDQPAPGRDVTVNRAFSRQFFEAVAEGNPEAGQAALAQLDASSPMEMLDESDLIEDAEEPDEPLDELDESDLIQQ